MKQLYGGIDIGSENHLHVIIDANEQMQYDEKTPHRLDALASAIE